MLNVYFIFTFLIYFFLKFFLKLRINKKKEDPKRFIEKLGLINNDFYKNEVVWFHGVSVGELKSLFPIIDSFIRRNHKVLVTTSTLSSYEIYKIKYNNNHNVCHQFAPLDCPQIIKKFFDYWNLKIIFFSDSEFWPNQIFEAKKRKIPIVLLNGRISLSSFKKWKFFRYYLKKILKCFSIILCQSLEHKKRFEFFYEKNCTDIGNLKFIHDKKIENNLINKNLKLLNKIIFSGLSTHDTEEEACINAFINAKKIQKNLVHIIIPRHIQRVSQIEELLEKKNIKKKIINKVEEIDDEEKVYIVNSYGKTNEFLNISKIVFMGGSLIKHGGQNPIEVALNNSYIFTGKYIDNFKEIYSYLLQLGSVELVNSSEDLKNNIINCLNFKKYENINTREKILIKGEEILQKTLDTLDNFIKDNRVFDKT